MRVEGSGEDIYNRASESYGICASDNVKLTRTFGSLLAIFNAVPLIFSVYECYRGRNSPSEFNESRYVSLSIVSLLETILIGLPITLVSVEPTMVFIARAAVLCVACLAILLPMFVPKAIQVRSPESEKKPRRVVYSSQDRVYSSQERDSVVERNRETEVTAPVSDGSRSFFSRISQRSSRLRETISGHMSHHSRGSNQDDD